MITPLSQCHASLGATQYSVQLAKHTRVYIELDGGRQAGRQGGQGRMVGGREEAMMLSRERASVEEGRVEGGRVDEGNERGRDGTRHGWREGKMEGRKRAEEGLSQEGREQGREGNFKGGILRRALASIQYIHKPSHNAGLALETLVLQMKNNELV